MITHLKRIAIYTVSLIILLTTILLVFNSKKSDAVSGNLWQAGRIIDDNIFTNKDDMSASDIQNFLNSKVPLCDSNGTKPSEFGGGTRANYASSKGWPMPFTCLRDFYEVPKTEAGSTLPDNNYGGKPIPAGAVSAATLIYNAAQKYNINPKVLLVKLATESPGPLTTDEWPLERQYHYAMGAHCPDSGPGGSANCDSDWAGFSLQIDEAARLMRWYLNNMKEPWWPYKKPLQTNYILWNVAPSGCGGSDVYVATSATAALYTYTPYQPNQAALNNMYGQGDGCSAYGNRNFWRVWNDWFGSTQSPEYNATPLKQSDYPYLMQGDTSTIFITYKNTGNAAWYDEISAWPAGQKPVRLGTDYAPNRNSSFGSTWRFGPSRAADTFSAVYEADGLTLTADQHIAYPGEIVKFEFNFVAPINLESGYYKEAFRPIVEGGGAMSGAGAWLGVTVSKAIYQAQPTGQSHYPTLSQTESENIYFRYKNTGNVAWYDEISAWPAGQKPVRLGTDYAPNRNSSFGSTWRFGPSRAADTFSAVYEADGLTLTADQHIAYPGEIVKFEFNFVAPINLESGYYKEAFRPIVEGGGAMSGAGAWLGVTVSNS